MPIYYREEKPKYYLQVPADLDLALEINHALQFCFLLVCIHHSVALAIFTSQHVLKERSLKGRLTTTKKTPSVIRYNSPTSDQGVRWKAVMKLLFNQLHKLRIKYDSHCCYFSLFSI